MLNDLTTIRKENEKILQTNDTLLHSINLMKANLEKLKIENSYYKEYFYKFIHSIKHKSRYSISDLTLLEQPDKQHQETCEKTKTSPKLVIYQVNKNEIEDTGSLQIDIRKTKEFLINLAKDFYLNTKIRNFYNINQNLLKICDITNTQMKSNEIKNFLRPKRCLSNPLLYIQEKAINLSEEPSLVKRKRFFKKKENRKKIAFKNKTEMEKLMMGSPMPSIYDIKNGVNTPFLLDISKIIPFNFEHSFME